MSKGRLKRKLLLTSRDSGNHTSQASHVTRLGRSIRPSGWSCLNGRSSFCGRLLRAVWCRINVHRYSPSVYINLHIPQIYLDLYIPKCYLKLFDGVFLVLGGCLVHGARWQLGVVAATDLLQDLLCLI